MEKLVFFHFLYLGWRSVQNILLYTCVLVLTHALCDCDLVITYILEKHTCAYFSFGIIGITKH